LMKSDDLSVGVMVTHGRSLKGGSLLCTLLFKSEMGYVLPLSARLSRIGRKRFHRQDV
jgi:hypothetical protein